MDLSNNKILIIHDYLTSYGGAEHVLEGLMKAYPEAKVLTSQIIINKFKGSLIEKAYNENRIIQSPLFKIFPKYRWLIKVQRKLSFFAFLFLDASKFNIVLINTSSPATWIFRKSNKQKFIVYYHKILSIDFYGTRNPIKKIFSKINHYFISRLDLIITNSEFNKNNFNRIYGYPLDKITVVYPFISNSDFEIINHTKTEADNQKFFLYLGRIENYKGIEEICDICIKNNYKLKIVGTGPLENRLPKSENIELLGYVSDSIKYKLLKTTLCLISLGGDREEFGITYLEALLCRSPFIAMNRGGSLEIGDNETAFYINSINELSTVMDDIYNKRITRNISEDKVKFIRQKFSENRFISEIKSVCLI